jgi:LCP family protein required for cell wall assembly
MGRHFSRKQKNKGLEGLEKLGAQAQSDARAPGENEPADDVNQHAAFGPPPPSSASSSSADAPHSEPSPYGPQPEQPLTAKPHRSWARRLLIAFNILLAVVLIGGIGTVGYIKWQYGRIDKLSFDNGILNDGGSKDPMTVLLVGSDSRESLAPGQSKSFGSASKVAGQRSDTIMLLRVDPAAQRAAILSLPRDLWVTVPGTGGKNKINSTFDGGPEQLIKTIKENFDIPIDHYAQVDFDGFKGIVDAIGGVQIPFSAPVRDWGFDEASGTNRNLSGLDIKNAGCINLTGTQALSYVRSRHYQVFERGRWVSDPQSDITRIQRQQDFIRRVMRKAISKGSKNPVTLNALVSNGVQNLQIDDGFSLGDITSVARRFQSLDASKVEMMTMPNRGSSVNGVSVLLPKQPEAKQTIDRFLNGPVTSSDGTKAAVPVSSISVRLLNGSGVAGQASETATAMREAGFVVSGVGDGRSGATTTIRYATGNKDKADVIASYIGGEVKLAEDPSVRGVDAIITTGTSFSGIVEPGSAPPSTTTTTAPPVTTTPPSTTPPSPFVPSGDESC